MPNPSTVTDKTESRPHGPPVLSVSELTALLKECMESQFPRVAVVGEVSNCVHAGSGHVYLTLKDDAAQLRGVVWRNTASRLRFDLRDGLQVVAIGRMDLYPARGSYQLVIDELVPHGMGPLELAFRQLHEKLEREGLFAAERKRPLPRFPRRIALVTSPQGAAVRDMLQIITRRWPQAQVVVVPVPVQGDGAAVQIAAGIELLPRLCGVDVAIVGRGGGSVEDLWCFNEEVVARAIIASPVPIISAVGHEIDVTIADLVADRRALTPSEAGELVVPDFCELEIGLKQVDERLRAAVRGRVAFARSVLDQLSQRRCFTQPAEAIHHRMQRTDELARRLTSATRARVDASRGEWGRLGAALSALSPLRVLERGYSLTTRDADGGLVRSVSDVRAGDVIATRVPNGTIRSRIE